MAVTPRTFFQPFAAAVFNGVHNFATHTLRIALTNVEPVSTYANLSQISQIAPGGGYSTGGFAITTTSSTQATGVYRLILQDYTLSASGTIAEWQYAVLYNDTAAGDPLIAWYTFAVPFNLTSGNTFLFDFDGANGALNFAPGGISSGSVTAAVAPSSVTEDGTSNLIFTFTRTGITTAPLTVNYTIGGTAVNGTDYATIGTTATFGIGSTTATVTVNPSADATIESNETVVLTVAPGSGYVVGSPSSATGTIQDDDAVTDPDFADVVLLLPMNGANGSTTFTDESNNAFTVTANGNAQISTTDAKWDGSCGLFDGTGDFLTTATSSLFNITGDGAVQLWYRPENLVGNRTLIHIHAGGAQGLHIYTSNDRLAVDNGLVADFLSSSLNIFTVGVWSYVGLSFDSGALSIGLDGTLLTTRTPQSYGTPDRVQIGRYSTGGVTSDAQGRFQAVRITNGVGRDITTVPSAAFPTS